MTDKPGVNDLVILRIVERLADMEVITHMEKGDSGCVENDSFEVLDMDNYIKRRKE